MKTSVNKDTMKKVESQATNWEKIQATLVTDNEFGSKIYEEL